MSNYEHYQATVEKVNTTILRQIKGSWLVKYQSPDEISNLQPDHQPIQFVTAGDRVCQRLTLHQTMARAFWPENEPVSNIVTEYVVRGAARLAPLRQQSFRNNFPHWLQQCLQQLHHVISSKEQLMQVMADPQFPYPSKVKIEGNYLPCWVWCKKGEQFAVSVIDRRTGLFNQPRTVDPIQLVDSEKWFGAQVIDSADESIETVSYYISELFRKEQGDNGEPTLTDAITNPCSATLSPVASFSLVTGVVVAFFVIVKMFLGF